MASVKAKGAGAGRPKAAPQYVLVQPIIVTQEDWVQCENPKCEKWRRLPAGHPPIDPDAPWYCNMSPDPLRNSCDAPEEEYNDNVAAAPPPEVASPSAAVVKAEAGAAGGQKRKRKAPQPLGYEDFEPPSAGKGPKAARRELLHCAFPTLEQEVDAIQQACRAVLANAGVWNPALAASAAAAAAAAAAAPSGHAPALAAQQQQQQQQLLPQELFDMPYWLWNGLHHFAPRATALARQGVDVFTAAHYQIHAGPAGREAVEQAALHARLALMTAASLVLAASEEARQRVAPAVPAALPAGLKQEPGSSGGGAGGTVGAAGAFATSAPHWPAAAAAAHTALAAPAAAGSPTGAGNRGFLPPSLTTLAAAGSSGGLSPRGAMGAQPGMGTLPMQQPFPSGRAPAPGGSAAEGNGHARLPAALSPLGAAAATNIGMHAGKALAPGGTAPAAANGSTPLRNA